MEQARPEATHVCVFPLGIKSRQVCPPTPSAYSGDRRPKELQSYQYIVWWVLFLVDFHMVSFHMCLLIMRMIFLDKTVIALLLLLNNEGWGLQLERDVLLESHVDVST